MRLSLLATLATLATAAVAGVVPQDVATEDVVARDVVPQEDSFNTTNIDERSLEIRQTGTAPGCGLKGGVPNVNCYCSGAIEFGEIINKGIEGLCDRWNHHNLPPGGHLHGVWCRTGNDVNGKCEFQNTVNYHIRLAPECPVKWPIFAVVCKQAFYELKDTCAWSFDSHKGGWLHDNVGSPCRLDWEIDVNS